MYITRAQTNCSLSDSSINLAAPISTAPAYIGIKINTTIPPILWIALESYLLPRNSGKVWASRLAPISLVFLPKNINATNIPSSMFKKASQRSPIPRFAAWPPKPTIADVEIKVAPYEIAITYGCVFLPPTMKSEAFLVRFQPR